MSASVLQYKVYQNTSDDGSIDITFDSAVTGGSTIVVTGGGVNSNYDGPTPEITGISDTQSNTYGTPVNVRVNDWTPSTNMVSAANVAAGSTTITVTLDSTSANIIGFVAFELGGTATASQETIVSGSTEASGTSVSTSSTGTLSQSDCIAVICGQGWFGNPSGATGYTAVLDQSNGGNIGTWIGYKSLSSTSSISGTVDHVSVALARNAILGIFKSSLSSTYNESASDSAAATETAAGSLTAALAVADSAAATDSAAGGLTASDAASDTAAGTDAAVSGLSAAASAADSADATDSAAAGLSAAESVSDSGASAETAAGVLTVAESASDDAAATDAAAGALVIAVAVTDTAAATDATTDDLAGGAVYNESAADAADASETAVAALIAAEAVADAADASDAATAGVVAVNLHPMNRVRSRYAVRLGGEMVFVDSPQALQAAIDDFEQQTQDRARRKGDAVAKKAPQTTPKAVARSAPRASVVDAPEVDRAALAAQMAATNARIRAAYENATRAALIARYMEIEMRVQDDEAAVMALE